VDFESINGHHCKRYYITDLGGLFSTPFPLELNPRVWPL
jgi:hypothetical protein